MPIITRLTGGLGNQLFQYCAGLNLAQSRRSRVVVDVGWYDRDTHHRYALDNFLANPRAVSLHPAVWKALSMFGFGLYHQEPEVFSYDTELLAAAPSLIEGYWQNAKYIEPILPELRQKLRLRRPLSPGAKRFADRMAETNSVAVHIRRGDYLTPDHQQFHGLLREGYYRQAEKIMREQVVNPEFYVFSDDADSAIDLFPGGAIVDVGTSIEQWELMRRCNHHIIANSTYSWWAATLADGGLVVAPRQWLAGAVQPSYRCGGLYMPGWRVI